MVQCRKLTNDDKGVMEPLNETCGGMMPYPHYGDGTWVGEGVIVRGASFVSRKRSSGCQSCMVRDGCSLCQTVGVGGMAPGVVAADNDNDDAVHVPWPNSKMPLACSTKALPDNVMLMTFLRLTGRHDPPTYLL